MSSRLQANQIKTVTWQELRGEVMRVNPELASIIDQLDPDDRFPLVVASYGFGEEIAIKGCIRIPDHRGVVTALDQYPDSKMVSLLNYCPTPLVLQLSNSSEMFLEMGERVLPLDLFCEGELYSLFETCLPLTNCPTSPVWNVTAGSRSAFMLPKITDTRSHGRLKSEYGFYQSAPNRLSDHFHVFKAISASTFTDHQWSSRLLLFTEAWFKPRENDLNWLRFHYYILQRAWIQSRYMRMRVELSFVWEAFAAAVRQKNLKPGPYLVDTIKHLVYVAMGYLPAFKATDDSQLAMPTRILENAYAEVYQLKEYAPTIMHPFRLKQGGYLGPIYYSLGMPSLFEGTPTIRKAPSIITELREIKRLVSLFYKVLQKESPQNYQLLEHVRFAYYHSENDPFGEIENSCDIPEFDQTIQDSLKVRFAGKEFPTHGQFLRGCISLCS